MKFRVDNVPVLLQVPFLLFGYGLGILLFLAALGLRLTCRITYSRTLSPVHNYIYALWHQNLFGYFICFPRHAQHHVWMNHPAWVMKPIHVLLRLIGIRQLILGSTGHQGKDAALALVPHLQQGASTLMAPDGPRGPARHLKKGVLHLACQSGVPIVPLQITSTKAWLLRRTWDQKRIPKPFSRIHVTLGEPLQVSLENFSVMEAELTQALG